MCAKAGSGYLPPIQHAHYQRASRNHCLERRPRLSVGGIVGVKRFFD
jgi:hypothetical protein